jgi:Holliday junction resolvase RusA-like endonuclease
MRLVIPDIPKSPNKRRGEHWSISRKYAEYWEGLVRSLIDNSHKPVKARRSVSISQMRRRKLDRDNLWASCKPVIDALTHWQLIKDDSEEWIELNCTQAIGKEKITIVEIQPV